MAAPRPARRRPPTATRVDAESGEQRWSVPVPKDYKWRASPTGADGRIWMMDHGGNVLVVNAQDGEVQHQAAMGADDSDQVRSSIVVAGSSLLIRADEKLYCIAEKEKMGAHWPSFRATVPRASPKVSRCLWPGMSRRGRTCSGRRRSPVSRTRAP